MPEDLRIQLVDYRDRGICWVAYVGVRTGAEAAGYGAMGRWNESLDRDYPGHSPDDRAAGFRAYTDTGELVSYA